MVLEPGAELAAEPPVMLLPELDAEPLLPDPDG
jgi:hypothetical protein